MATPVREMIRQIREEELSSLRFENYARTLDEGRGMEHIPNCPHCGRPTVITVHEYTPQINFSFAVADEEPERECEYYTCEWCGSEIDPADVSERAPRKPASRAVETWDEHERRRA